jgi:hypothetical protein
MKMGGKTEHRFLIMPRIKTFQQRLELRGIPGCIQQYDVVRSRNIKTVGRVRFAVSGISIGRINVKIVCQVSDGEFARGKVALQRWTRLPPERCLSAGIR